MIDVEAQFEPIAKRYAAYETDRVLSRYELEVNWPSIQRMLPPPPAKVLDYGCGSGLYSQLLLEQGYEVVATDNSQTMLNMVHNPKIKTYLWSYHGGVLPVRVDAILAKLVVQFVDDLQSFAIAMRKQLHKKGRLVISIPHPAKSKRLSLGQGSDREYIDEVSKSGLRIRMIHRDLEEYKQVFEDAGFLLIKTEEPQDPHHPGALSKRLNVCFEAAE